MDKLKREVTGSFYTPQIWVELSQKYLADVFGTDWQDDYYIWDCAAGTGNLLNGLTNKYNIFASTLDRQDVDVMKDRIENGANLLEDHVFQFDFLNDSFDKLPKNLQTIIKNPEERKKLIIYINPPYAEHGNRTTISGKGEHKSKVSTATKIHNEFVNTVGTLGQIIKTNFCSQTKNGKKIPNFKMIVWLLHFFMDKIKYLLKKVLIIGFLFPKKNSIRGQSLTPRLLEYLFSKLHTRSLVLFRQVRKFGVFAKAYHRGF